MTRKAIVFDDAMKKCVNCRKPTRRRFVVCEAGIVEYVYVRGHSRIVRSEPLPDVFCCKACAVEWSTTHRGKPTVKEVKKL